jgi:CNT family concentrative nucleoside transporter
MCCRPIEVESRLRTLIPALLAQVSIGALVLFVPLGSAALAAAARGVNNVLQMGDRGVSFMFGGLVDAKMFQLFGGGGFVFALRVLPMIIFVTALIAVLYHIGVMKWIINGLGVVFEKLLAVTRVEACSAVATIFLGQSEMPAFVKPFVREMTAAELFAVMSSGMASVAGSVLAGYAGLGVNLEYLLAASFMAIPGGLLFAKLIFPTTEPSRVVLEGLHFDERKSANVIEAAAAGASIGLRIAINVGAMLIAFIGLIALLNSTVSGIAGLLGHPQVTLQSILGWGVCTARVVDWRTLARCAAGRQLHRRETDPQRVRRVRRSVSVPEGRPVGRGGRLAGAGSEDACDRVVRVVWLC